MGPSLRLQCALGAAHLASALEPANAELRRANRKIDRAVLRGRIIVCNAQEPLSVSSLRD